MEFSLSYGIYFYKSANYTNHLTYQIVCVIYYFSINFSIITPPIVIVTNVNNMPLNNPVTVLTIFFLPLSFSYTTFYVTYKVMIIGEC